jgi:hypothetical protein
MQVSANPDRGRFGVDLRTQHQICLPELYLGVQLGGSAFVPGKIRSIQAAKMCW